MLGKIQGSGFGNIDGIVGQELTIVLDNRFFTSARFEPGMADHDAIKRATPTQLSGRVNLAVLGKNEGVVDYRVDFLEGDLAGQSFVGKQSYHVKLGRPETIKLIYSDGSAVTFHQ